MSKKEDALKLAQEWYDSGNENPDDFADMIKQVIALAEQPAQQKIGVCGEKRGACGLPCEPCEGKTDPDYVQQPAQQPIDLDALGIPHGTAFQPAQQQSAERVAPVAWMDGYRNIYSLEEKAAGCEDAVIPLVPATLQHWSDCAVHNEPAYPAGKCDCGGYTSPPASKPFVGLTDEELPAMWKDAVLKAALPPNKSALIHYKEAIEAKLREKNA